MQRICIHVCWLQCTTQHHCCKWHKTVMDCVYKCTYFLVRCFFVCKKLYRCHYPLVRWIFVDERILQWVGVWLAYRALFEQHNLHLTHSTHNRLSGIELHSMVNSRPFFSLSIKWYEFEYEFHSKQLICMINGQKRRC